MGGKRLCALAMMPLVRPDMLAACMNAATVSKHEKSCGLTLSDTK